MWKTQLSVNEFELYFDFKKSDGTWYNYMAIISIILVETSIKIPIDTDTQLVHFTELSNCETIASHVATAEGIIFIAGMSNEN